MTGDKPATAALDLSSFDEPVIAEALPIPATPHPVAVTDPRLAPAPPAERLVDVSKLSPADLEEARRAADRLDFRNSLSLLAHGDDVLGRLSETSRKLLADIRLGESGEVGKIAAAILDGVKILRIEDLQKEAGKPAPARTGLLGRLVGMASDLHTAYAGFAENRKRFLDLMDAQVAQARRTKADLAVSIDLLDQQSQAVRESLGKLKLAVAAAQLALDRGEAEAEALRQHAIETADPADAAMVMEFRATLANFRGKTAELRESLIASATLIPLIGQNRRAAETRLMKISNGILVTIPRMMAVASQAAVQAEISHAAEQSEKLEEAQRRITILASKGAHDAAVSAARSLGGDDRNVAALAQAADDAIRTMHEVLDIEAENARADADREKSLIAIRDRLVTGMQGVYRHALDGAP